MNNIICEQKLQNRPGNYHFDFFALYLIHKLRHLFSILPPPTPTSSCVIFWLTPPYPH